MVAVSEVVATALERALGVPAERVRMIPTGVDADEFRPAQPGEARALQAGAWISRRRASSPLFVGDAKSPRKNLDLCFDPWPGSSAGFRLAVVSRSTTGGPYPAAGAELGVERPGSHFLGPGAIPAECLRDADALLCVSHYEPPSLVLLEGMASGLPVICTPGIGNAPFVAGGESGFVLRSPADGDGLVEALTRLAAAPELAARMGRAARRTAETLTWARMGSAYEALYGELVARRASRAGRLVRRYASVGAHDDGRHRSPDPPGGHHRHR